MEINFHFEKSAVLPQRIKLKAFICSIFKLEKKAFSTLTFVFCSDKYLLAINKTYLRHNYYTDIVTFNLSSKGDKVIQGEIYISVDRVKENAKIFNNSMVKEAHRVIFHGVLHLCNYQDNTQSDKMGMRKREDFYLHQYFDK